MNKYNFLQQTSNYKFLKAKYFSNLASKQNQIYSILMKKNDFSIMTLKAKLNISSSNVSDNDQFITAKTQSEVTLINTVI
jgi:hypothetical protein